MSASNRAPEPERTVERVFIGEESPEEILRKLICAHLNGYARPSELSETDQ